MLFRLTLTVAPQVVGHQRQAGVSLDRLKVFRKIAFLAVDDRRRGGKTAGRKADRVAIARLEQIDGFDLSQAVGGQLHAHHGGGVAERLRTPAKNLRRGLARHGQINAGDPAHQRVQGKIGVTRGMQGKLGVGRTVPPAG